MAKRKPQRALILWGFLVRCGEPLRLGCCYLFISIQPFAYVVANYTCYNRDKKSENNICHAAFTSFLLEVRQPLHHIIFHANILHNSCCDIAMAAITRTAAGDSWITSFYSSFSDCLKIWFTYVDNPATRTPCVSAVKTANAIS